MKRTVLENFNTKDFTIKICKITKEKESRDGPSLEVTLLLAMLILKLNYVNLK